MLDLRLHLLLVSLLLGGCGQSGALYLPERAVTPSPSPAPEQP